LILVVLTVVIGVPLTRVLLKSFFRFDNKTVQKNPIN
jgi:hypothetical protein